MFSLICARINGWVNKRAAGDLRRHRAHYNAIVMRITQTRSESTSACVLGLRLCVKKAVILSFKYHTFFLSKQVKLHRYRWLLT